jgi:hypothetical protein
MAGRPSRPLPGRLGSVIVPAGVGGGGEGGTGVSTVLTIGLSILPTGGSGTGCGVCSDVFLQQPAASNTSPAIRIQEVNCMVFRLRLDTAFCHGRTAIQ